jgi:hypothetical protein
VSEVEVGLGLLQAESLTVRAKGFGLEQRGDVKLFSI